MTDEQRWGRVEDEPEEELPPMADDEEAGDPDTPLEGLVEEQREDGMSWLDDRVGIDDYDAETIADEIGAEDGEETLWMEGSEGDEGLEGTEADLGGGEEYGWTLDSDEPEVGGFDDDLGLEEGEGASILDDAGEEGVEDELVTLDPSLWKDLGAEDEGEGTPDLEDADIGFEDVSYELEQRMGGALLPERIDESLLMAAWLGPAGATAAAVCFGGGQLWAAGSGLYKYENGALVPAPVSGDVEDAEATTVQVLPGAQSTLYVGTMLGGLLRCDAGASRATPINSWTAVALGSGRRGAPSLPVYVAASRAGGGTLWLRTGAGHLLASLDKGESWSLVAPDHRVLAAGADQMGPAMAALGERRGKLELLLSESGEAPRSLQIPSSAARELREAAEPRVAVGAGVVAVGAEELTHGIVVSFGGGQPELVESCPRATALAVGPGPSPYVLAGLFFAGRDLGTLLRGREGATSWVRVCDVSRLESLFDVDDATREDVSARIHDLAVSPLAPRQVAMATGHGVFVIEMKDLSAEGA